MNPSLQAETVLGSSRGALIVSIFGGIWLCWGLSIIGAFTPARVAALVVIEIAFLAGSVYFIRKGGELRKQRPPLPEAARRKITKWYWITVVAEVVLILAAVNVAANIHRPELIPDWIAIVVGLHFFPLAKIFRAPSMAYIGTAMVLWCVFCWIAFRGNTLGAAAAFGAGALLWIASASALLRARKSVRALHQAQPATIPE
ncbi:MAG: hypothetical protein WBQ34_08955 [Candidatus Acidiferrales bacterium]